MRQVQYRAVTDLSAWTPPGGTPVVVYSEPPPPPCLQLPVDPMDATSGVRIVYRLNGIPRMAHLCGMCCLTPVTSVP